MWTSPSHFSYPTEILPWLSIGGNMFTDDIIWWLECNGYSHTINASGTRAGYAPRQSTIGYMELPLSDTPEFDIAPWLEPVAKQLDHIHASYINELRARRGNISPKRISKVLVHCQAGVSRSVTLVAYWLMTRKGMTFDDAITFIRQRRKIANPNKGFTQILKNL